MDLAHKFGVGVGLVMLLAWLSPSQVLQKLSMQLLVAWAASNVLVHYLGFVDAPILIPSLDALIAVLVATTGYHNRSNVALTIFLLYALVAGIHLGAFIFHLQGGYVYYAILNVIFALQLLVVGVSSAWMAVRYWTAGGTELFHPHPPGGAGVA